MANGDPIIFNRASAARIKAAVKAFEDGGDDLTSPAVNRNNYYDRTFWATIDSSTPNGTNKWKYAWTEVKDAKGTAKTGARAGLTTNAKYATNGAEHSLGSSLVYSPVPTGSIVLMKFSIESDGSGGTRPAYSFSCGSSAKNIEYVAVGQDGGSAGDATTPASWTYSLTTADGTTWTTQSPLMRRIASMANDGANGWGYWLMSGGAPVFQLVWVDEQPQIEHCGTEGS